MKEEQEHARANSALPVAGDISDPNTLRGQFTDTNFDRILRITETAGQRVCERARSILSPDQLASFAQFQTNRLRDMRATKGLMQGLYGPDKSAGPHTSPLSDDNLIPRS